MSKLYGEDYKDVYLNSIPSLDYDFENKKQALSEEEQRILKTPMIKCEIDQSTEQIEFYRSGKRSAIVVGDKGELIRLKGCGNDTLGFNL